MEDHMAARRGGVPDRWGGRRQDHHGGVLDRDAGHHQYWSDIALALRLGHPIYGMGLSARGRSPFDRGRLLKILYFAWVRERIGKAEEDLTPPGSVATIGE